MMTSYSDLPEAVRDHLASLEIFIGDMDDLELRNGDVIDASALVPAFNGIVAALRATPAQPAGMREAIARIIEPWTWHHKDRGTADSSPAMQERLADSLKKADAILALPAERPAIAQAEPDPAIVRQHIAWLFQYVQGMNKQNWHDMKMNAERQLEQLSLIFRGAAQSSTLPLPPDWKQDQAETSRLPPAHRGDAT